MKKIRKIFFTTISLSIIATLTASHATEPNLPTGKDLTVQASQVMDASKTREEQLNQGEQYITDEMREKIEEDNRILMDVLSRKTDNETIDRETTTSRSGQYNGKRLYIFLSSSMPEEIIRRYIQSAEDIQKNTLFVIRGFIGGIKKFKPTLDWVIDVLCDQYPAGSDQCLKASIDINPNLFSEFNIEMVPAVLFLPEGTSPCNMCEESELTEKPGYISYGDARLIYHLTNMAESESPHKEQISDFVRKLQNSFYYNQSEGKGLQNAKVKKNL